jgi:hypothetical protein
MLEEGKDHVVDELAGRRGARAGRSDHVEHVEEVEGERMEPEGGVVYDETQEAEWQAHGASEPSEARVNIQDPGGCFEPHGSACPVVFVDEKDDVGDGEGVELTVE